MAAFATLFTEMGAQLSTRQKWNGAYRLTVSNPGWLPAVESALGYYGLVVDRRSG